MIILPPININTMVLEVGVDNVGKGGEVVLKLSFVKVYYNIVS